MPRDMPDTKGERKPRVLISIILSDTIIQQQGGTLLLQMPGMHEWTASDGGMAAVRCAAFFTLFFIDFTPGGHSCTVALYTGDDRRLQAIGSETIELSAAAQFVLRGQPIEVSLRPGLYAVAVEIDGEPRHMTPLVVREPKPSSE